MGLPGAKEGMTKEDPTIADLRRLRAMRLVSLERTILVTGTKYFPQIMDSMSFWKSLSPECGGRPENPDYPKNPEFKKKFGPRGVIHSWANADGTIRIQVRLPKNAWKLSTMKWKIWQ